MSQVVRYVGQKYRGLNIQTDSGAARCPDCKLLFWHAPECGLDMSTSAMNPGNAEVAALADGKAGM